MEFVLEPALPKAMFVAVALEAALPVGWVGALDTAMQEAVFVVVALELAPTQMAHVVAFPQKACAHRLGLAAASVRVSLVGQACGRALL